VNVSPIGLAHAARAFWRTRRLTHTLRTPEDVRRWQASRLERFLARVAPRAAFYANRRGTRLDQLPIVDKAQLLAAFEQFNRAGVTLAEARAAIDAGAPRVRGYLVGQSTGTSGNRGVFVISEAERFTWLGVMLAKALPDVLTARLRVALALPAYSQLYASAAETGRIALRFFDLRAGVAAWRDEIAAFAPDVIVAPPKVLRALAETTSMRPARVFSGAEVLDPLDRQVIEAAFQTPVREIYMATEGLLGVACPLGVLHLAEDAVHFEWERAGSQSDLVKPLITDFTRSTQIMARYRMNDLLRLRAAPCTCGSPLQAVESVEGRLDDVFELRGADGALRMVTPDVLRNAVVDADRRIDDFRIVQTGPDEVELALAPSLPAEAAAAAAANLSAALRRAGAADVRVKSKRGIDVPYDRKLRRVMRVWRPS